MYFPVDFALQRNDIRRAQLLPEAHKSEAAQKVVEIRCKIIVDSQSLFDQFLAAPLKVFEAFRFLVDPETK